MPITFSIDRQAHRVNTKITGPITLDEVLRHLEEEHYRWGLQCSEFIDATEATAVFSSRDAREIVAEIRKRASEGAFGATAILVADDVTYGMCRMLEILLDDVVELRPFRQREEAEEWLRSLSTPPS